MAQTEVKDVVIWAKHIHGDKSLSQRISALKGGETLELRVDGVRGSWRKMDDGRDGRPTYGIRPVGKMQDFWRELYASRRGDLVEVDLLNVAGATSPSEPHPLIYPALARNEEERQAALEALISMGREGSESDGWKFNRDELYDHE